MKMEVIQKEKRLCTCCMEEHEVKTVKMLEQTRFKNISVDYEAVYFYCDKAEELYEGEEQIRKNDMALKDSYRRIQGLLTSEEIRTIRKKYDISQIDFCVLLGWGGKTIARYEGHQVQDKAHDTILRKIANDPEWFLELLVERKSNLPEETYRRYYKTAASFYENSQDRYLRKAIEAKYIKYENNKKFRGNTLLSLDKTVDVIRYFAACQEVTGLYKVKLMKLMWYADSLSYKKRGHSITGLVYQALPMGAVPVAHDSIIHLKGVPCEEIEIGEGYGYFFNLSGKAVYPSLQKEDITILNTVVKRLGKMTKSEIINYMHKEKAYEETTPRGIISFEYAESLQI